MQSQPYEKYKLSDSIFYDYIPENWDIKRIKDYIKKMETGTSVNAGDTPAPNDKYGVLKTSCVSGGIFNFIENKTVLDEEMSLVSCPVKINSVIVSRMNTPDLIGESGIVEYAPNNIYLPDRLWQIFFSNLNPYFFNYFTSTIYYRYFLKIICVGTSSSMQSLSQDKFKLFPFTVPSNIEQVNICIFLKEKIALIDSAIKTLKLKKEKYVELKQTFISDTVTRGLDKNIEMKDNDIEWIGKIPKHWGKKRVKEIFIERSEKNCLSNGDPFTENILSVMKDVGVINHRDKGLVGNKMSEDITGYKLVHINDIVVNKMNVMIGSVGIAKEFGALSIIYIILKTRKGYFPKYYDYLFKIKRFQRFLRRMSTGILEIREAVNMTLFMGQYFPVPPESEQITIAEYLDERTGKIDTIVGKIDENIAILEEFRKTLINDAVTGKIKVD